MRVHEDVFFSLVRNALWDTQVTVPDDFWDWGRVMRLAKSQAMEGAVAKALLDSPEVLVRMKPGSQSRLSKMLMTNVVMHSMTNSSVQVVVSALKDAGVDCVLLKGQGLAAHYRHPEVRDCGDIDLYVGSENYRKSYEVLRGVVDEIDAPSALDGKSKHYHALLSGICIEIHQFSEQLSSCSANRIYQQYASEGLSRNLVGQDLGEVRVMTPADNYNAFFVFNHLWNHFISVGVGIRQICDWAMFLHVRGTNVDRGYLGEVLEQMNLTQPWKIFGCIAVDVLGLPADEFPFYDPKCRKSAAKVLYRILVEGDMGRDTEFIRVHSKGYLAERLFSLRCHFRRFCGLVTLFPRHAVRQLCYAVVGGIRRIF